MSLDLAGFTPLYRQLEELLRAKILDGSWAVGSIVPSEAELMATYGVSRNTVRQAIKELETQGYVHTHRGRGRFVSGPQKPFTFRQLDGFADNARALGLEPGVRILVFEEVPAGQHVAAQLQLEPSDTVVHLYRLLLADGEPIVLADTYLPKDRLASHGVEISESLGSGSVHKLLTKGTVGLEYASLLIKASMAGPEDARLLDLRRGAPVIMTKRVTFTQDHLPVEYTRTTGRPDRQQWSVMLYPAPQGLRAQGASPTHHETTDKDIAGDHPSQE